MRFAVGELMQDPEPDRIVEGAQDVDQLDRLEVGDRSSDRLLGGAARGAEAAAVLLTGASAALLGLVVLATGLRVRREPRPASA